MAISNKTIISPHLEVYNHHGASTSSILHRITGFFIAVPALYFFLWNAPLTLLLEDLSNQYTIQLCKFLIIKNIEPLLCSKILQSIHGVNFTLSERIMFYSTHEWLVGAFYLFSIFLAMGFFTAATFHSLHGIQHWAWDDFMRSNSYRVEFKALLVGRWYEIIMWAIFTHILSE